MTVPARLAPRPDTPAYIQYAQPPLIIDGEALGLTAVENSAVRLKLFDYGVISVAISRPLPATWPELLQLGLRWHDDPSLATSAERCARELVSRIRGCLAQPNEAWIAEDYLVFGLHELEGTPPADDVLRIHGQDIARLLRGEHDPLSAQESEEVLRHRLSCLANDVYAARLFTLAAARLGLDQWKASVQEKLATLDSIYRFAVEQASMVRGEFLEFTVVLILLFELVFFIRDLLK